MCLFLCFKKHASKWAHSRSVCGLMFNSCSMTSRLCVCVSHKVLEERFPCDCDSPLTTNFGDFQTKVNRVVTRGLPLQDVITSTRLVSLRTAEKTGIRIHDIWKSLGGSFNKYLHLHPGETGLQLNMRLIQFWHCESTSMVRNVAPNIFQYEKKNICLLEGNGSS